MHDIYVRDVCMHEVFLPWVVTEELLSALFQLRTLPAELADRFCPKHFPILTTPQQRVRDPALPQLSSRSIFPQDTQKMRCSW